MVEAWEDFEDHIRFYQTVFMISACTSILMVYLCY